MSVYCLPPPPFLFSLLFFPFCKKGKKKNPNKNKAALPPASLPAECCCCRDPALSPSFCFSFCELIQWLEQQGGNRTQTMSSVVPGGGGLHMDSLPPHSLPLENNKPLPAHPDQRRAAITVIAIRNTCTDRGEAFVSGERSEPL